MKTHKFLSPNGEPHQLAYDAWGEAGNPPVVMVHGLTRNKQDFDILANALAVDSSVLTLDIAGRGDSDWFRDKSLYHYGTYLADVISWLDHCNVAQCQWVGTSMGGILGMMLAAIQPQRVSALILNDIGMTVAQEGLRRITNYAGHAPAFQTEMEAQAYLRAVLAPFGITEEIHWQHLSRHAFRRRQDGALYLRYDPDILSSYRHETKNFAAIEDIDLSAVWEKIVCPTLILRGQNSDILREDTAAAMAASRENVTLAQISNVGHAPALLSDAQINLVGGWLRKHRVA